MGTAAAYPLYFKILDIAGSSNLMLVTIIVPVFAIVLDAILLNQFVTASNLLGFTLVAIGLLIMDRRLPDRFGQRREHSLKYKILRTKQVDIFKGD